MPSLRPIRPTARIAGRLYDRHSATLSSSPKTGRSLNTNRRVLESDGSQKQGLNRYFSSVRYAARPFRFVPLRSASSNPPRSVRLRPGLPFASVSGITVHFHRNPGTYPSWLTRLRSGLPPGARSHCAGHRHLGERSRNAISYTIFALVP